MDTEYLVKGKYYKKTYGDVIKDVDYCLWVMAKTSCGSEMRKFQRWFFYYNKNFNQLVFVN